MATAVALDRQTAILEAQLEHSKLVHEEESVLKAAAIAASERYALAAETLMADNQLARAEAKDAAAAVAATLAADKIVAAAKDEATKASAAEALMKLKPLDNLSIPLINRYTKPVSVAQFKKSEYWVNYFRRKVVSPHRSLVDQISSLEHLFGDAPGLAWLESMHTAGRITTYEDFELCFKEYAKDINLMLGQQREYDNLKQGPGATNCDHIISLESAFLANNVTDDIVKAKKLMSSLHEKNYAHVMETLVMPVISMDKTKPFDWLPEYAMLKHSICMMPGSSATPSTGAVAAIAGTVDNATMMAAISAEVLRRMTGGGRRGGGAGGGRNHGGGGHILPPPANAAAFAAATAAGAARLGVAPPAGVIVKWSEVLNGTYSSLAKLTDEQRATLSQAGTCFKCRQGQHMSNVCEHSGAIAAYFTARNLNV